MKKISTIAATAILLSSCVTNHQKVGEWYVSEHYDEFNDAKACRVEKESESKRTFSRAFHGTFFTYHFYAENYDGQTRVGVRSEPPIAIRGDVQIKYGDELMIITAEDTPLDIAPQNKTLSDSEYKKSSPYRALSGKKAEKLLKDLIAHNGEVKFRTVGVNAATSGTGVFKTDPTLIQALKKCNINL